MKIEKILNDQNLKNILILTIFFMILVIIFMCYRIIDLSFRKEKALEVERLENIILEKNRYINALKKKLFIKEIDVLNDDSITKFVDKDISFLNKLYAPENLVPVEWKYVVDSKNGYIKVRKELKKDLEELSEAFYKDTWNNIVIVSWYRSYYYQKGIKDRWCSDNLCAKAWHSEHQSGLAIDIYSASSEKHWKNDNNLRKYFYWFKQNAHKYGFHNSYQNWVETDWYEIEPWHWRYLWKDLAKYLHEKDITFGEFYYSRFE